MTVAGGTVTKKRPPKRRSARQRMCEGKRGYDDIVIAEGMCDAMERQFPQFEFTYYQCLFCPLMHVGRRGNS